MFSAQEIMALVIIGKFAIVGLCVIAGLFSVMCYTTTSPDSFFNHRNGLLTSIAMIVAMVAIF